MKTNTKRMVIAGGSGFLGQVLAHHFLILGWEVVILTRSSGQSATGRQVYWDACTRGEWETELEGTEVLINLTGKSVNCRYHARNRKAILESRVNSTRVLGEVISRCARFG